MKAVVLKLYANMSRRERDTTKCNQIKFCNHSCDYSSQNMQNITIIPGSAEKTIITQTREVGAYLFKVIACL